jgi:hypothetical protein
MKKMFLLAGLALMMSLAVSAQPAGADAVVQAFKSVNADKIADHFDDFIDMKLLDKDEVKNMGRNQASIALKSFFAENGIRAFDKQSDRELGNTMYLTGKLQAGSKNYNITVMLKQKDNRYQIITIRIS